jgi:DNA-binding NarL/FixJ family response regulator
VIRVGIADDHDLVRAGIRMIVEAQEDMTVSVEAASGGELVEAVGRHATDVVLMDVRMPGVDGLEATRRVVRPGGPRVIVLTTFEMDEYVYEALRSGASGYLLKSTPPKELAQAIRDAAAGTDVLSPAITRRLVESFVRRPDPAERARRLHDLTEREVDVLRMLARGRSNAEIAGDLFLSEATVKTHLTRVLSKLGVRDRLQAVIVAYEMGFIEPGRDRP